MCRCKKLMNRRFLLSFLSLVISIHVIYYLITTLWGFPFDSSSTKIEYFTISSDSLIERLVSNIQTTQRTVIWDRPEDNPTFFVPQKTRVTSLDFNVILSSEVCKDVPFLVILVLSVHHRTEERRVIRETWGRIAHGQSWPGKNISETIKIMFLFGLPQVQIKYNTDLVKRESEEHRDVVMFDYSESYFNLTLKVLMGFKWIKEFCPTTKFVMKADEDIFVDVPQLVARLHTPEWTNKISGLLFTIDKTHRKGKYRVSEALYPFQYYPPHVKGNIYVMPTYIAMKLLNISEYMPYLNMEDVHITGILAIAAKVNKYQRLSNEEFSPMGMIRSCDFSRQNMIAAAFIRPQQARDLWTTIVNPKICIPN